MDDLEEGTKRNISTFADNTKLGRIVSCKEDARRLQGDLDNLSEWANRCSTTWLNVKLRTLV